MPALTSYTFKDAFVSSGRLDAFSVKGLDRLLAHLQELEAVSGIPTDLDVTALCRTYCEYDLTSFLATFPVPALTDDMDEAEQLEVINDLLSETTYTLCVDADCILYQRAD